MKYLVYLFTILAAFKVSNQQDFQKHQSLLDKEVEKADEQSDILDYIEQLKGAETQGEEEEDDDVVEELEKAAAEAQQDAQEQDEEETEDLANAQRSVQYYINLMNMYWRYYHHYYRNYIHQRNMHRKYSRLYSRSQRNYKWCMHQWHRNG